MHLDVFGAHPVSMLFSGAGVPLIGMTEQLKLTQKLKLRQKH